MSTQPILMTAQPGGASAPAPTPLTVTKAPRELRIPAAVLALPGLSLLACAVLAEVLYLHGRSGLVWASDEHFADLCRAKPRTIRDTLTDLVAAGYLTREVNYAAHHKRILTPTDLWQNPPGVVADSAGSSGEICRDFRQNPPGVVADSANINTTLNTKTNTNLKTPSPSAAHAAAGGGAEKKIERVVDEKVTAPSAGPIGMADASHTRGGAAAGNGAEGLPAWKAAGLYRDYDGPWPEQLQSPFQSPAFRAAWATWGHYRAEVGKPHRGNTSEQQDLLSLGRMAGPQQGGEARALEIINTSISRGWLALIDHKSSPTSHASNRPFNASGGNTSSTAAQIRQVAPPGTARRDAA